MKRTFTINISGQPFTIDDDAYTLLNDYLDALQHVFAHTPDGRQIQDDIESRIAELYYEYLDNGAQIITIEITREVIARIGKPEQFADTEEPEEEIFISGNTRNNRPGAPDAAEDANSRCTPPPPFDAEAYAQRFQNKKRSRKFYRDPKNKVLGGVCGGLAAFFNIDPLWVRLIWLLLFAVSGSSIIFVYILLWIIVPNADTPIKQMEMMGEIPTLANIGRTVNSESETGDGATTQEEGPQTGWHRFLGGVTTVSGALAKIFMVILSLASAPVVILMATLFLCCFMGLFPGPFNWSGIWEWTLWQDLNQLRGCTDTPRIFYAGLGMWISIAVGLLGAAIIYCTLQMLGTKVNLTRKWKGTLLVVWIAAVIGSGIGTWRIWNDHQHKIHDQLTEQTEADADEAEEDVAVRETIVERETIIMPSDSVK